MILGATAWALVMVFFRSQIAAIWLAFVCVACCLPCGKVKIPTCGALRMWNQ